MKSKRWTRREFLAAGAILGAAFSLGVWGRSRFALSWPVAQAAEEGAIRAHRFTFSGNELPAGVAQYASPALESPIPFMAIGVKWRQAAAAGPPLPFAVSTSRDGSRWSNWLTAEPSTHGRVLSPSNEYFSEPIFVSDGEPHRYLRWRTVLPTAAAPMLESAVLSCIDPGSGRSVVRPMGRPGIEASLPAKAYLPLASKQLGQPPSGKPAVVSRTGWGCPEGQNSPSWPPSYKPITAIVVHHSASANNSPDWAAVVRVIWFYHTVELDWGDIAYNYLVDPNGVLYEGRAGGDDAVGSHISLLNPGTLGLCFLGTYGTCQDDGNIPGQKMVSAAAQLAAWACKRRSLNPIGRQTLIGEGCSFTDAPTIFGHRDASMCAGNNTCCPGNHLWALLPQFRQQVSAL